MSNTNDYLFAGNVSDVISRTAVADAAYTDVVDGPSVIYYTTLSATRNVALSTPVGHSGSVRCIVDTTGKASTFPITITTAAGTISGAATITINKPFGQVWVISDGTIWRLYGISAQKQNGWALKGCVFESVPRATMQGLTAALAASGTMSVVGITVEYPFFLNNYYFMTSATAAVNPTNSLVGLYTAAGTRVDQSLTGGAGTGSTAIGAQAVFTYPAGTPQIIYPGNYYGAIMVQVTAGTLPTLKGGLYNNDNNPQGAGTGTTPAFNGTADTGLTTSLPSSLGAISATGTIIWLGLG